MFWKIYIFLLNQLSMVSIEKLTKGQEINGENPRVNSKKPVKKLDRSFEEIKRPMKIIEDYDKMIEIVKQYSLKKKVRVYYSTRYEISGSHPLKNINSQ